MYSSSRERKNRRKGVIEKVCYFICRMKHMVVNRTGNSRLQWASALRTTIDRCSSRYWNSEWISREQAANVSFVFPRLALFSTSRSRNEIPRVESGPLKHEKQYGSSPPNIYQRWLFSIENEMPLLNQLYGRYLNFPRSLWHCNSVESLIREVELTS